MRISTDVFSGILWLYPVAGTTLILCALRSMMRYHFRGQAHYVIHGAQIAVGIALGLLGLLNIGSGEFFIETHDTQLIGPNPSSKPIYQVVAMGWAIAIVAIAYTAVTIGTQVSQLASPMADISFTSSSCTAWMAACSRHTRERETPRHGDSGGIDFAVRTNK
jgi:hypothetical protein